MLACPLPSARAPLLTASEGRRCRLAMLALVGFVFQHGAYPGTGPVANLLAHVKDPYHITYAISAAPNLPSLPPPPPAAMLYTAYLSLQSQP